MKKIIKLIFMIIITMIVELFKHIVYTIISLLFIFLFKKLYFKYILSRINKNKIFINCEIGVPNEYKDYRVQFDNFDDYGITISVVSKTTNNTLYYTRLTSTFPTNNISIGDYFNILIQLLKNHFCSKIDNLNHNNDDIKINLSNKLKKLINTNFSNKINEKINGYEIKCEKCKNYISQ